MAVAVVDTGTAVYDSSGTTLTWTFTVSATATLAVFYIAQDVTQSITSVTWDSGGTNQTCTLVGSKACVSATNGTAYIYAVINPTSGTNKTLQIIQGTASGMTAELQSYSGTATSSVSAACTNVLTANGTTGTAGTAAQSGANGDMYVSNYVTAGAAGTLSDTTIYELHPAAGEESGANRFASTGASHSLTLAISGTLDWASVSCDIAQPSGASGPPIYQSDWPNPREPRTYRSWEFTEYVGRIPPPLMGKNQYDWPNPREFREYRNFTYTAQQGTIPPPLMGKNQYDWPNPLGSFVDPNKYRSYTFSEYVGNIPPPNKPLNQYDWPLPGSFPRPDETFTKTPFTGNIPPPVQPFNQFDWPNPREFRDYRVWIVTPETIPPPIQGFNQFDWPNPREFRQYRSWEESPFTGNIPPPLQPFNQFNWPNPAQFSRLDETWINLGIIPSVTLLPFNQMDWPNPREFRDFRSWVFAEYPGNIPPPLQPFNQFDWPNPKEFREGRNIAFGPIPNVIPFNQYDWPVPKDIRDYRSWINSQQLTPPPFPFNQYDWPNPRTYPPIDQTFVYFNPNTLTFLVPPPTNKDWPIPRGYIPIDPTWIYSEPPGVIPPPVPPPLIILGGQKWKDAVLEWKVDSDAKIKEAAAQMSKLGGQARALSLTAKQRSNIASVAAKARWK